MISLVWLTGIYVTIGVVLMVLGFRARDRYRASVGKVRLRQQETPGGRQRTTMR